MWKRVFDGLQVGLELLDLGNLDGIGHGVAGCSETDGDIGVFQGFGKDGNAAEHDAAEFLFSEVG